MLWPKHFYLNVDRSPFEFVSIWSHQRTLEVLGNAFDYLPTWKEACVGQHTLALSFFLPLGHMKKYPVLWIPAKSSPSSFIHWFYGFPRIYHYFRLLSRWVIQAFRTQEPKILLLQFSNPKAHVRCPVYAKLITNVQIDIDLPLSLHHVIYSTKCDKNLFSILAL